MRYIIPHRHTLNMQATVWKFSKSLKAQGRGALCPPLFLPSHQALSTIKTKRPMNTWSKYRWPQVQTEHLCGQYPALLYMTDPLQSTPALLHILVSFAKISGLEANQATSRALNVTIQPHMLMRLPSSFPFHWTSRTLKNLGIQLTKNYADLIGSNYNLMLTKLTSLLRTWSDLHITAVKMSLLPKILNLFRVLRPSVPRTICVFYSGG